MFEQSPSDSPNSARIDLHMASPDLAPYDQGTAVAAAALHATSSERLRAEVENPPLQPIEIIAQQGLLVEVLRRTRTL